MNPTLLDEWAAWCECAMLCEGELDESGMVILSYGLASGICAVLARTKSFDAWRQATARAERNRPPINLKWEPYWWPHTREGWDARAAFCWRMAEECELEENQTCR